MEINKVISLILGVLVVLLLLVWVNNRFKAQRSTTTQNKITTTPARNATATPTPNPTAAQNEDNGWGVFSFLRRSSPTPTARPTSAPGNKTVTLPPNQALKPKPSTAPAKGGETKGGTTGYTTYNSTSPAPQGQQKGGSVSQVKEIPNTGVSTLLIPSLLSSLAAGIYLSKSRKK